MGGESDELYQACSDGDFDLVKKLHGAGQSFDVYDEDKQVALHHVANGSKDDAELLQWVAERSRPGSVSIKDAYEMTPFHIACENGHLLMVKYMTTVQGFDPALRRNSAAFLAARHQHTELLDFLVKNQEESKKAKMCTLC